MYDVSFSIADDVIEIGKARCALPKLIAVTSGSGFILLIRSKQERNRRARLEQLIENYKNEDDDNNKYAVFLSYSSLDAEFVIDNIVDNMDKRLKKILETDKICVATGDFNFRLGFPINEEIIRCIDASVIVFCVSVEFCRSRWSQDEVIVACYDDKKPIILMFL